MPVNKALPVAPVALFLSVALIRGCFSGVKPLISLGWQGAIKKFAKSPKATAPDDDNYYEGSLGHTRRMPGPEAAVSQTRGIRHGINR
ncbi:MULTISPECIES: hypothetical protein [Pseudomonas]|uniref:hypothetical protein n=1 Tax=Pseudomonas TaxID=286 RepID=UPI00138DDE6B|nr:MULTISPECIES: hypothetical protein [Pseudomonas]